MWIVRALATVAVALAVALCTSCGSRSPENSIIPTYIMGDHAQAGPLIYTVFDAKWMPQLGQDLSARIPTNRFLLLRLSIVNSGSSDTTVPVLVLTDDSGGRHQELSDGEGVPQWTGYVRRMKPAEQITGNIIFDVPPQHYKLEVSDEGQEKKAIVDIPLSFSENSDSPVDLPMPEIPVKPSTTPVSPKPVSPK